MLDARAGGGAAGPRSSFKSLTASSLGLAIFLGLACAGARAAENRVFLKDGKEISCRVLGRTAHSLIIRTPGEGITALPRSRVDRVEGPAPGAIPSLVEKTDPGKTDPGKADPGKTDPGKTEPGKVVPVVKDSLVTHVIHLKDGTVIRGKITVKTPDKVFLRGDGGKLQPIEMSRIRKIEDLMKKRRAEYKTRAAKVGDNDPKGQYELGAWCAANGLANAAKGHLAKALKEGAPDVKAGAAALLEKLKAWEPLRAYYAERVRKNYRDREARRKLEEIDKLYCPTCKGTRRIQCPTCKGRGVVTCTACRGTGRVTPRCDACGGKGRVYVRGKYVTDSRGKRTYQRGGYKQCAKCSGKGVLPQIYCKSCSGTTTRQCPTCRGKRTVDCPRCSSKSSGSRRSSRYRSR
jgi:hypothetical protein